MSVDDREAVAERARLVGRTALLLSVAPMLFYVWQAIGVPGIPGLGFGGPFAHADSGMVVRIAGVPHDPVRVGQPVRSNPRRARAAAPLRPSSTIKAAVAPAVSRQAPLPPPADPTTPAARAPDGVRDAPVAAPPIDASPVQVPTVPSVQIPVVQIPPALPVLSAAPDLPALPTVLGPALP